VRIIGRYVLREHVGPFVFATTALTSLMLLQYIAKKFGDLVGKGLPGSVIAEFIGLSVPFTVAMTLPMAMLVAVLYAFSRLASENEITAMKASGVSMRTVLAPVLLAGAVMSLVMLFFNDQVLPRANHRLAVLQLDIFRTKPTFALREQVINEIKSGQLYLRAGDIDEATSRMQHVEIYDLTDRSRRRTIYADSGRLASAPNGRDIELVLFHGEMQEVPNKKPDELNRMFYEKTTKRVRNVMSGYQESTSGNVSKGDREMSVCEMQKELSRAAYYAQVAEHDIAMADHELRNGPKPEPPTPRNPPGLGRAYCAFLDLFTVKEARAQTPLQQPAPIAPSAGVSAANPVNAAERDAQYIQRVQEARFRLEDAKREQNRYGVEIQKKFSLAAACMIFVLIGAPIALRFPRGGVGLVIGVSFAVFGIYYVGLIGGESLANKGILPAWIAMWAVNILLLVVGLVLAARMGRESSTARGGDFGELLMMARTKTLGWLRRFGISVERRRA
jgi:lipopolysaccharide export system permease protein